jgi:predicted dehydrogenase
MSYSESQSTGFSRRGFVAATALSSSRVLGANERVRLGVIGNGGRGRHLIRMAQRAGGAEFVALSDAWAARMDEAQADISKGGGGACAKSQDYRRLLDNKDVDAVLVVATDHQHSRMTVAAVQAGKDVFVEKPMVSLPAEGLAVVKAVKASKQVVQVGVQQRSISHFIEAKQRFIDSGAMGEVRMVRTYWNANTGYLTKVPPGMEKKPADLDWDAVLGPLPKRPWTPWMYFNRFASWEFSSGGQTGGLFVHLIDVVMWYLGLTKPQTCVALGGIYQYKDERDTADNINMIVTYPQDVNVTFEATISDLNPKESVDIVFLGSKGRLHIFRGGYRFIPAGGGDQVIAKGGEEPAHMGNFLECVKSRKTPNANVVDGHYGSVACYMGNVAYKERRAVNWDSKWDA